nr:MAG TPA: hypothetical protein [Bacteriophage sp.]
MLQYNNRGFNPSYINIVFRLFCLILGSVGNINLVFPALLSSK